MSFQDFEKRIVRINGELNLSIINLNRMHINPQVDPFYMLCGGDQVFSLKCRVDGRPLGAGRHSIVLLTKNCLKVLIGCRNWRDIKLFDQNV